jgi:hypothetical protein
MPESIESNNSSGHASRFLTPVAVVLASAAVFGYAVNLDSPWESDQPAKAAQILEIAAGNDYLLSDKLVRCYNLKLLPLYYCVSGLVYEAVGGPIFRFMNLSSVAGGVLFVLSAVYAVRNALGVHPLWSALVLLSMPILVISSSYGNESIWALAFYAAALWLVTCGAAWLHYAAGAAMACSIFCRMDMVLAVPFLIAWAAIFTPPERVGVPFMRRMTIHAIVLTASVALLWILLVRMIPRQMMAFEWKTNPLLMVAFLSYPFNPSIVLAAVAGWLVLCKLNIRYAAAHFLLLTTLGFYFSNLSSPKYIVLCVLFYGIPAALLLQRSRWPIRVGIVAAILFWWLIGVSNFGVFRPARAALWYVPSVDGPIPSGGYIAFYQRAREGFYQAKQHEHIVLTSQLAEAANVIAPDVRLVGQYATNSVAYVRYFRRQSGHSIDPLVPPSAKPGDTKLVLVRTGYIGLARGAPDWLDTVRGYLGAGQVRSVFSSDKQPLPDVIEVGEQVPPGTNNELGQRIAFVQDYYQGHMVFELPEFVAAYAATSWIEFQQAKNVPGLSEPIYHDREFSGFDRPAPGAAQTLGYPWPARIYKFRAPRKHF